MERLRENNSANDMIEIETTIHAPIENVWQAWTDPVSILKWFGSDPNGKGVSADLDLRPGGSYIITFKDSDQTEHTCFGAYTEVKPFTCLTFSWSWKNESGVESFVTINMSPDNNNTRMLFRHANVGTTSKHNYMQGWQATFEKLDRLLADKNK